MMNLCFDVLRCLQGKTLASAESCTGGGIGHAITAVPGSSAVYKGGIISYCNEIKHKLLDVSEEVLQQFGAVSEPVACAMAQNVRLVMETDIGISATGLAGPDGDSFSNEVGTVFIGYSDASVTFSRKFLFFGNRDAVRDQAIEAALQIILERNSLV